MAQHIIPEHEIDEHEQSEDCRCEPELSIDDESGEMVWIHNILNFDLLFDEFI